MERFLDALQVLNDMKAAKVAPDDFLDGEDVVPGFRCRLADVID